MPWRSCIIWGQTVRDVNTLLKPLAYRRARIIIIGTADNYETKALLTQAAMRIKGNELRHCTTG